MIPQPDKHNCTAVEPGVPDRHPRDVRLQIYISLALGVPAFLAFCASPPPGQTRCDSSNQAV
jgi:hypothetical protein